MLPQHSHCRGIPRVPLVLLPHTHTAVGSTESPLCSHHTHTTVGSTESPLCSPHTHTAVGSPESPLCSPHTHTTMGSTESPLYSPHTHTAVGSPESPLCSCHACVMRFLRQMTAACRSGVSSSVDMTSCSKAGPNPAILRIWG